MIVLGTVNRLLHFYNQMNLFSSAGVWLSSVRRRVLLEDEGEHRSEQQDLRDSALDLRSVSETAARRRQLELRNRPRVEHRLLGEKQDITGVIRQHAYKRDAFLHGSTFNLTDGKQPVRVHMF